MSSVSPYPPSSQPSSPYGSTSYSNAPYASEGAYPQAGFYGDFVPPPKKSKTPLVAGIIAAVLVLGLLGGIGGLWLLDRDEDSTSSASSEKASSDRSLGNNDPFGAQASTGDEEAPLGELIQPEGAPYSYRLPAGFVKSPQAPDLPRSSYTTAVSPAGISKDALILVNVVDAGGTDLDRVEEDVKRRLTKEGHTPTSSSRIRIDGEEALRLTATSRRGDGIYHYAVTTGGKIVVTGCGGTSAAKETLEKGCQQVLDSMKID